MSPDMRTTATGILDQVEKNLRGLLREAVDGAPYEDILWLTRLAEQVHRLIPAPRRPEAAADAGRPGGTPRVAARASAGARRASGYPKFEVRGNLLVKTGWSKKKRKEYVHKAPLAVLDAVRARIADVAKDKPTFTMEDVLPVPNPDGNGEVPSYQAYLCLAYLVNDLSVAKAGNDGYHLS